MREYPDNSKYAGTLTVSTGTGTSTVWSKVYGTSGIDWGYGHSNNTITVSSKKAGLAAGTYFVHVIVNGEIVDRQVLWKK